MKDYGKTFVNELSIQITPYAGTGKVLQSDVSGYGTWGTEGAGGGSGSSGTSGTSGVSGTSGTSGSAGSHGTSGSAGSHGTSGVSGTSGTSYTGGTATYASTAGTAAFATSAGQAGTSQVALNASADLPTGHISGLILSNDAGDTEHDINITAGKARDVTDAADMVLAAEITKQADAAWAVGDDAGGMDTGAVPASATVHVWLIKRSDTGVVDALFSISATAPTMPANYDYKRLIGSYRTDASNNILNGDWFGTGPRRTFKYDTPILDINATNPGANMVTAALSVPAGVLVIARFNALFYAVNNTKVIYFHSLDNADVAPSLTAAPLANLVSVATSGYTNGGPQEVKSDTSSQIAYRLDASGAGDIIRIATTGYEMSL